jgi:hypothetical protein
MIVAVIVIGLLVVMLVALFAIPAYVRRHPNLRGSGSGGAGMFGVADEIFNPSALEGRRALDEESRLIVPAPSPDGDKGIRDGRITLHLEH